MDNLNTHNIASLYQAFPPEKAFRPPADWRSTTPPSTAASVASPRSNCPASPGNSPPATPASNSGTYTLCFRDDRLLDAGLRGIADQTPRHDRDPSRPLAQLSKTQIEVLRMVAMGMSNEQIVNERG